MNSTSWLLNSLYYCIIPLVCFISIFIWYKSSAGWYSYSINLTIICSNIKWIIPDWWYSTCKRSSFSISTTSIRSVQDCACIWTFIRPNITISLVNDSISLDNGWESEWKDIGNWSTKGRINTSPKCLREVISPAIHSKWTRSSISVG